MAHLQETDLDRLRRLASLLGLTVGVVLLLIGVYARLGAFDGVLIAVGGGVVAAAGYDGITKVRRNQWYWINRAGLLNIFDNRKDAFKDQDWVELVQNVTKTFRVLGVANHGYVRSEARKAETENAFRKCLGRKDVEVSILWLDPRAPHARMREEQEGRSTRADIVRSIVAFWEMRERMPQDARPRMHFFVYAATPSVGITWHDEEMVVTHYLEVETNLNSPGLILTEASFRSRGLLDAGARALTKRYTEAYQEIRSRAEEIDHHLLDELKGAAAEYEAVSLPSEADLRTDPSQRAPQPGPTAEVVVQRTRPAVKTPRKAATQKRGGAKKPAVAAPARKAASKKGTAKKSAGTSREGTP